MLEMHKYFNKYGPLPLTRFEVCLWNWASGWMKHVRYFEVVEGGLSEMRWKIETPDTIHDAFGELKEMENVLGVCVCISVHV